MRGALAAVALLLAVAGGGLVLARGDRSEEDRPMRPAPLDFRRTLGRDAPFLAGVAYELLYRATAVDRIPAIDQPRFDDADSVGDVLAPSSLVVGLELGGEARAYPTNLLSLHEIVNDELAGVPVAVTWCPLCSTALAFDRRAARRTLSFGVSGWLLHANLLLYDRESGSLWSQLHRGAITGRYRGTRLRSIPLVHETWAAWRRRHPETKVLSIRQDRLAYRFTQPSSENNAYGEDLSDVPYGAYATKVAALFPRVVRGLREGSRVLGVVVNGHAKAYPVSQIRARIATADVLGGEPILVTFDDEAYAARVLARRLDGRPLTFRVSGNRLLDGATGSRWTLAGEAEAGPLKGRRLRLLPSTFSYWFAWRRFHPAAEIFAARGDRTSDGGNVDRR